jgi:hypothetical protein
VSAISQTLLQPFESAGELREQHGRLLEALDEALVDASETEATRKIEPAIHRFLERATATGTYLEDVKERTGCQALVDYWVSGLAQAGVQAPAVRLAAFDAARLPDLKDKPCPYVGLEAFRDRDREYFFGREPDAGELIEQLAAAPLLVVLGASGSGKSSLIMGGVLPALSAPNTALAFRIAPVFVPGSDVLVRLVKAVQEVAGITGTATEIADELRRQPASLAARVGDEGPPILVTIDQFEEVFTLCKVADRDAAAAALAALLGGSAGHRVILTMREEFRSRLVELQTLVPYLDRAWYSMRPMGYAELRAAVERPAALVNLQFQPGIADDLVKKVLGQPAALPLLQFTLRELWNRRDRNRITREVYRKVGDPLVALKSSADAFFDGLAPQTQAEVKRILLELVRVDELLEAYRQPVPGSTLLRAGKANTEEVLALLAEQDWVRTTNGNGADAIVEVKHEALIRNWPRLVGWIDEKRIERRQRLALTQAAQRWAATGRPPEGLLTGWQLEEAKRQSDLSEVEREFVDASAAQIERAQRERESALRREAEQARALARRERRLRNIAILAFGAVALLFLYSLNLLHRADVRQTELEEAAKELGAYARALEQESDRLKADYGRLQAEYNQLFAKQVQKAVAPQSHLPSSQPVTIYIHISDESQRARAEDIRKELVKSGIGVAPGVERVADSPRSTQVRYFRPMDRLGAEEIRRLLTEYLGVRDIETSLIKGYETKVPGRHYEIWFGPDAFGGSARAQPSAPALPSLPRQ